MKKYIFLSILFACSLIVNAQVPSSFNYQAVLRNSDGTIMANESVSIQVNLIQGTVDGSSVYAEIHNTSTTEMGLISLEIGTGSTSDNIDAIDWGNGPYFLEITINGTVIGTSQLLSVPYAIHAGTVDQIEETDPQFNNSVSAGITELDTIRWNAAALGEFVELDPVYSASPASDITQVELGKLANLSGVNSGDQDLSSFSTQQALEDTAQAIRIDIPDVSSFLDSETDPVYSAWDKDYEDLTNTPVTITADQSEAIIANSGKDTSGIYHSNRAELDLITGINSGDQDLSIVDHSLTISGGSTIELPDEVDDDDPDSTNEIQDLALVENELTLSNDESPVDLTKYLDNTDNQDLVIDTDVLSIENGSNTVDLSSYIDDADADPLNEIQVLSISDDTVFLSGSNFITLPHPGPYFIPTVTYQIGGMGSPYTIDISGDLPSGVRALITVVEFFNYWTVDYYGGSFFEAYYGDQAEDEKVRIENPIEDTNNANYYTQSGSIRMQMIVPVIDGSQIVIKHIGVSKLHINGYYR